MPTVQEIIDHLQLHYKPDDVLAYSYWGAMDVLDRARHWKKDLLEGEAEEVLERMHRGCDAEVGLNWIVMDFWIDEVIRERKNNAPPITS